MKMVEEQEETSENVLRSRVSRIKVPIRFNNRSGRRVKIIWRNYRGEEVSYATLETHSSAEGDGQETLGHSYFSVNTFVTNPWIAVDESSNERMLLNFQEVYMPSPPQVRRIDYRRRKFLVKRTDVIITAPELKLEMLEHQQGILKKKTLFASVRAESVVMENCLHREGEPNLQTGRILQAGNTETCLQR